MSINGQPQSFFSFDPGAAAFNEAFTQRMREIQKEFIARYIPPRNTYRLYHGRTWSNPANADAGSGEMQVLSAEMQTRFDDIISNDLGLIQRSLDEVAESLQRQFADSLYRMLSEASDASGNVVNAQKEGSLPASFLAMLEKVEFSVDKDGKVHMPEIHADPATARRMLAELEASPPEFRAKVEQITQKKILAAQEHEAARKAKFARYGE